MIDSTSKTGRNAVPCQDDSKAVRLTRRAYTRPVLHVYGAVAQLTMTGTGCVADSGHLMMAGSDRRLKEQVIRIGDHPLGIGIYLFWYVPAMRDRFGHGRRFGVMADEVEVVLPQAIARDPEGYQVVNYAMLGVRSLAS